MIDRYRFIVVMVLLLGSALFIYKHENVSVPVSQPLSDIPRTNNGWTMVDQVRFDERVLEVLKPTEYLSRSYVDTDGKIVQLYVGYHNGGPDAGPIHSPRHCLPGSGWFEISNKEGSLSIPKGDLDFVLTVYGKDEHRELFLYWYQVRGESLTNEYLLKATEVINSIVYKRRDSAFIRISIPIVDDVQSAENLGVNFISDFYQHINEVLPN